MARDSYGHGGNSAARPRVPRSRGADDRRPTGRGGCNEWATQCITALARGNREFRGRAESATTGTDRKRTWRPYLCRLLNSVEHSRHSAHSNYSRHTPLVSKKENTKCSKVRGRPRTKRRLIVTFYACDEQPPAGHPRAGQKRDAGQNSRRSSGGCSPPATRAPPAVHTACAAGVGPRRHRRAVFSRARLYAVVCLCRMPAPRAAVSAALVAALVVSAIALATWGIAGGERRRVELSPTFTEPATPPKVGFHSLVWTPFACRAAGCQHRTSGSKAIGWWMAHFWVRAGTSGSGSRRGEGAAHSWCSA